MISIVLYCPHLGRDLREIHEAVPDLGIFVGEETPKGEDGCLQNHQAVVSWARACGLERVFVMEDDCTFTKRFNFKKWCHDAEWAQSHGYDVMAGGCTRTYDEKVIGSLQETVDFPASHDVELRLGKLTTFVEVSAFHSAHCLVYFKSGYEKVLNAVQPYDLSLGRDCGMRCVLVHPFVAVQRKSFSGILRRDVNYEPLYEQHEQRLAIAIASGAPLHVGDY